MNVLVIGPHPDDQEIGMGGTIAKLADQGHRVLLLDMTDGSPTPRGDRASRLKEAQAALAALQPGPGKPRVERVLLDLKNREVEHTLEARHAVAGVIRAHQARVLFVPHPLDAHPDHRAVTRIAEDARFDAKLTKVSMPVPPGMAEGPPIYPTWLFYYDVPHLRRVVPPSWCMDITGYLGAKLASIRAYESQFGPGAGGPPGRLVSTDLPERIEAQARAYGAMINTREAEAFFTHEPLGLSGLDGLTGIF